MSARRPTTTRHGDNQADACRERGWGPGTRLAGDEGHGVTVIEITGLGRSKVLARVIEHDGEPRPGYEVTWTLSCRDWQEVTP